METTPVKNSKDLDALIASARENAKKVAETTEVKRASSVELSNRKTIDTSKLFAIRTYSYDANEAIKNENASMARIKLAEDKQTRFIKTNQSNGLFWPILVVLLIIGAAGSSFIFLNSKPKENIPAVTFTPPKTFIEYDNYTKTTKEDFVSAIKETKSGVTYVLVLENDSLIKTDTFLKLIKATPPAQLERNLDSNFMLGTIDTGSGISPFVILKSSYSYAFAGARDWENTLAKSFENIFNSENNNGAFTDLPTQKGVTRGNENIVYSVFSNGYILVAKDLFVIEKVSESIL